MEKEILWGEEMRITPPKLGEAIAVNDLDDGTLYVVVKLMADGVIAMSIEDDDVKHVKAEHVQHPTTMQLHNALAFMLKKVGFNDE